MDNEDDPPGGSITNLPSKPLFTKLTRLKYSSRSFWIGVPDNSNLRLHFNEFNAVYVWFSQFFSLWPCVKNKKKYPETCVNLQTFADLNSQSQLIDKILKHLCLTSLVGTK